MSAGFPAPLRTSSSSARATFTAPARSAAQSHRGYRPLRDSSRAYTLAGRRQRSRYHALRRRQRIRNERAERARPGCRNVLRQADGGIKIREGPRPPAFISFSLRSFKALVPQMYAYRSNTHRRYKYARYQQRPFTPRHVTPHIVRSSSSVVIV